MTNPKMDASVEVELPRPSVALVWKKLEGSEPDEMLVRKRDADEIYNQLVAALQQLAALKEENERLRGAEQQLRKAMVIACRSGKFGNPQGAANQIIESLRGKIEGGGE